MKKVLVLCYIFPPFPGIGGRRWAKFCKELHRAGHDLRVISFKSAVIKTKSNWTSDIKSYEERIEYFSSYYPIWLENPKTFLDKILYRLSLLYVKLFTKGNYYDKSSFLQKTVTREVTKKIEAGYKNIIVSCAPFKLALWVSEMKVLYPDVNLIVDFRDPWIDNKVSFGFESMSKKRKELEILAEKKVIDRANVVTTVAKEMTDYFRAKSGNPATQFITIDNGFDFDDFTNMPLSASSDENPQKLRLIFVGSLYNKALHHVYELIKTFDYFKEHQQEVYENIQLEFYGNYAKEVEILSGKHPNLKFLGNIPNQEIYGKIQKSHGCMTFLTDEVTYCFNTKFFEYLSQKKPILIFSKAGTSSKFIVEHGLGYSIEPGSVRKGLLRVYEDFKNKALLHNSGFDISNYNVRNLSKQFENLLK